MATAGRAKKAIKKLLPRPLLFLCRFLIHKDALSVIPFLLMPISKVSFFQKLLIIKQLYIISDAVPCPHTQHEVIAFIRTILALPESTPGCIVEAGAYKGGSTAKFSIAAAMANRRLVVFDSFEGLPPHTEEQGRNIFGEEAQFPPGSYCGSLDEVKLNVERFGVLKACEFIKGLFDDTMPRFSRPIAAMYLDVDLASSTRSCLKCLYPLLVPGGALYSQDGHLPRVIDVFNDDQFWSDEVGCPKPHIKDLGKRKLIRLVKE